MFLIEAIEIKIDYLLEKDLGLNNQIEESSPKIQEENESTENLNLFRSKESSRNKAPSRFESFKQVINNGI